MDLNEINKLLKTRFDPISLNIIIISIIKIKSEIIQKK